MFLTSMYPNGVQITWNFTGASFTMEQDFWEKEVQQRRSEGETTMAHAARCLGHVGPTHSHLVAPIFFISLDASCPKIDYIKGPPPGREMERRQNIETWNRSQGDQRSEGKTLAGSCRCGLHPIQRLYLRHHDKRGVVHLWTMVLW
jgi:hypothetical protein